jgi:YidC/Oxa1 family membrane protein insertase
MITAILQFFGRFLLMLYNFCHSYALSLIVFTLLIRLVLSPFSLKSKRSMMQMNILNGEVQKLQKQYGKDQNRLNEETQKLYEREGVNPMSGCLWSFLPLPLMMAVYYIIRRPLLYMMCLTEDQVSAAVAAVKGMSAYASSLANVNDAYIEMKIAGLMSNADVFATVQDAVGDAAGQLEVINFNLFGIDLSQIPTLKFWETFDTLGVWGSVGLFLIPLVVIAVQLGYTKLSQWTNSWNNTTQSDANAAANQSTKMMMYLMPLMYLWFGFIMPAGMCVYMIFSSLFMAVQELICAKILKKDFAKMKADQERRSLEAKEAEKAKRAEIAARRAAQAEANRNNRGKKKVKKGGTAAQKDHPTTESRVGVRAYARGRAYDPDRYPVTPYRDPQSVIDEVALAEAYEKKGHKVEAPVEEPESLVEAPVAVETPEETPAVEAETEAPASADELFASIQEEAAGKKDELDS